MSKEPLVTKSVHALSVLGIGSFGTNIVSNLPALNNAAAIFCIECNGVSKNTDVYAELSLSEIFIIVADASDVLAINKLPELIAMASNKNALSLCLLFAPSDESPTLSLMHECIAKVQAAGGKTAVFSERSRLMHNSAGALNFANIHFSVSNTIKLLVQQLTNILTLDCAVALAAKEFHEVFQSSKRFTIGFAESTNKNDIVAIAKQAAGSEYGDSIKLNNVSALLVFVEADDNFTLGDYALLGGYIEESINANALCRVGVYIEENARSYKITIINVFGCKDNF